jgi:hypothetical protein
MSDCSVSDIIQYGYCTVQYCTAQVQLLNSWHPLLVENLTVSLDSLFPATVDSERSKVVDRRDGGEVGRLPISSIKSRPRLIFLVSTAFWDVLLPIRLLLCVKTEKIDRGADDFTWLIEMYINAC